MIGYEVGRIEVGLGRNLVCSKTLASNGNQQ